MQAYRGARRSVNRFGSNTLVEIRIGSAQIGLAPSLVHRLESKDMFPSRTEFAFSFTGGFLP